MQTDEEKENGYGIYKKDIKNENKRGKVKEARENRVSQKK